MSIPSGGYLYASTDGGQTWQTLYSGGGLNWTDITLSANGLTGAAISSGGCIYLYDLPAAVQPPPTNVPAPGICLEGVGIAPFTAIASSDSGKILVAVDQGGLIVSSYDHGLTWLSHPGAGNYSWTGVATSSDGSTMVAVSSDGVISVSTNQGQSWVAQPNAPKLNWTEVACAGGGLRMVAAAATGQVYTSTDGGVTWSLSPSPPWGSQSLSGLDSSTSGGTLAASVKVGPIRLLID